MHNYRSLLTQDEFRSWLEQFGADQVVGFAKDVDERPIARFMGQATGEDVAVLPTRVSINGAHIDSPPWVKAIIHEVDTAGVSRITRARMEQILDECDWLPAE